MAVIYSAAFQNISKLLIVDKNQNKNITVLKSILHEISLINGFLRYFHRPSLDCMYLLAIKKYLTTDLDSVTQNYYMTNISSLNQ